MKFRLFFSIVVLLFSTLSCADDPLGGFAASAGPGQEEKLGGCCEYVCPNNFSVIIRGDTDSDNACLYHSTSGIRYVNSDCDTVLATFSPVTGIGYLAFVPFNRVCSGADISLQLCKKPPVLELCEYTAYSYAVYITTQGQGSTNVNLNITGAFGPDGCDIVPIGSFECCISGTSSCQFIT